MTNNGKSTRLLQHYIGEPGKYVNSTSVIILLMVLMKLLIPLFINHDFGFQRDELLYMAQGNHLSWGFIAVPPFTAFIAKVTKILFGYGLYSTRFFPALSGAFSLWLTTLIAKEMGGNSFARILSGVSYLFALAYIRMNLLFQPVTFNVFFFVLGAYLFIRVLKTNEPKYWIWLGITIGIGLLNKYTMLLFGFGITAGLLLTGYRTYFLTKWSWISAAIAIILFLPNLIWQQLHQWPFFQQMQILNQYQFVHVHTLSFLIMQVLQTLFVTPVWIIGLCFLFTKQGKKYRPIGWAYLTILMVLLIEQGKAYYLAASYPMLIAAGSVMIEQFIDRKSWVFLKKLSIGLIISCTLIYIPVGIPVFSVPGMIRYFKFGSKYLYMKSALRWETGKYHSLPQDYADMLGWEKMASITADIYHSLPKSEQKECAVFANNYGEASAINYYSSYFHIPQAISSNSSYWYGVIITIPAG
ncbi:MAG TPA: glycosyltransferase family 39 protein [Balneolales bacterium]|nr:glycosyltransferase family 39 protein [Balneolales bacterium]